MTTSAHSEAEPRTRTAARPLATQLFADAHPDLLRPQGASLRPSSPFIGARLQRPQVADPAPAARRNGRVCPPGQTPATPPGSAPGPPTRRHLTEAVRQATPARLRVPKPSRWNDQLPRSWPLRLDAASSLRRARSQSFQAAIYLHPQTRGELVSPHIFFCLPPRT